MERLQTLALTMKAARPTVETLQYLLESVKNTPAAYAISAAVLQALPQARYTSNNPVHFGLASDAYCHFTSPIRRYPDLQIHRIIKSMPLDTEKIQELQEILPEVCVSCSRSERVAESLERDVAHLKKVQFVAGRKNRRYHATVSGVTSRGIFVMLENTAEGIVPMKNLVSLGYKYHRDELMYKSKRSTDEESRILRHGSPVYVRLVEADEDERTLTFIIHKDR
jgi:ribonuclease R